jgi:hypothetical protein
MSALQAKRPRKSRDRTAPKNALSSLFGPPPLIDGEDAASYEAFARQVRLAVAPADALEEIWTQDIVNHVWEVQRLRRLKGKYLQAEIGVALKRALEHNAPNTDLAQFMSGWKKRDRRTVKAIKSFLMDVGVDVEEIIAWTYAEKIGDFEKIDRLIAMAESRRNLALRELERRRESLARRLEAAVPMIEAVEFREVADGTSEPK